MQNRYLVKIAAWDKIHRYFGDVTGKSVKNMDTKIKNVSEFVSNGETLHGLRNQKKLLDVAKTKARVMTGAVAGGVALAGVGLHARHVSKQKAETRRQLDEYYGLGKSASVASTAQAAKQVGGSILGTIARGVKKVVKGGVDVANTAGGGKIKDYYYHSHGVHPSHPDFEKLKKSKNLRQTIGTLQKNKNFKGVGNTEKERTVSRIKDKSKTVHELTNLHRQKRDARIAVGSTAAAGGLAYSHHVRTKRDEQKSQQYY